MKRTIFFILCALSIILLALSFSCDSYKQDQNSASAGTTTVDKASAGTAKYLINNSTIYKVEKDAVWTTTLNQLQVITRFAVISTTVIMIDGKPAKLEQLKPGFKVTIYYYDNPYCMNMLGCFTAVRILAFSNYQIL